MAFNWQTFRTRTLTAAVFVVIMLTGLLWNFWSFLILFSVIHFGCWWEYLKLTEKIYKTEIDKILKYFLCISGYLVFLAIGLRKYSFDFIVGFWGFGLSIKWVIVIIVIICLFAFLFQNRQIPSKAKRFVMMGVVYISLSWGLMIDLRMSFMYYKGTVLLFDFGRLIPLAVVFSIWVNDTMAYVVGSFIGKTPLSPISPKKTWEGTLGGIILATLVSFIYGLISGSGAGIVILTLITVMAGTIGDLFESKLKRMAGVKDSGTLMPGHGGFLDRFDSLLFATPFVWLYVQFFLN